MRIAKDVNFYVRGMSASCTGVPCAFRAALVRAATMTTRNKYAHNVYYVKYRSTAIEAGRLRPAWTPPAVIEFSTQPVENPAHEWLRPMVIAMAVGSATLAVRAGCVRGCPGRSRSIVADDRFAPRPRRRAAPIAGDARLDAPGRLPARLAGPRWLRPGRPRPRADLQGIARTRGPSAQGRSIQPIPDVQDLRPVGRARTETP